MERAIFDSILADIAAGESAKAALRERDINSRVFWAHLASSEDAANQYARAKARGLDRWSEDITDIADEQPPLVYEGVSEDGQALLVKLDSGFVAWQRNRIDARKWVMSKLAPKKYGDKIETTVQGPNGGPMQVEQVQRTIVDPKHTDAAGIRPAS